MLSLDRDGIHLTWRSWAALIGVAGSLGYGVFWCGGVYTRFQQAEAAAEVQSQKLERLTGIVISTQADVKALTLYILPPGLRADRGGTPEPVP